VLRNCATAGRATAANGRGHEIGIHAVRVGDNVGEHNVIYSTLGETLELSHRAHARDCYARGAIQAAKFSRAAGWRLHDGRCLGTFGRRIIA